MRFKPGIKSSLTAIAAAGVISGGCDLGRVGGIETNLNPPHVRAFHEYDQAKGEMTYGCIGTDDDAKGIKVTENSRIVVLNGDDIPATSENLSKSVGPGKRDVRLENTIPLRLSYETPDFVTLCYAESQGDSSGPDIAVTSYDR